MSQNLDFGKLCVLNFTKRMNCKVKITVYEQVKQHIAEYQNFTIFSLVK